MGVSRETFLEKICSLQERERLTKIDSLIKDYTSRLHLVSQRDLPFLWDRHFLDSLRLIEAARSWRGRIVDVGSGNGFPGLVFAACHVPIVLVERSQKKATFLRMALRMLGLDNQVLSENIQSLQEPCDYFTARAFSKVSVFLDLTHHLMKPSTQSFLWKGRERKAEIEEAQKKYGFSWEEMALSKEGSILQISQVALKEDSDCGKISFKKSQQ